MVLVSPPLPPSLRLELRRSHRMDEDQTAELFGLRPDRMKLRIGELDAVDAPADRDTAQTELLDAVLDLLDREIGVLQRHRGEGDETIGLGGAQLRELLVLHLDERLRDVALRLVPVRIDAESLDVDALPVHGIDTLGAHDELVGLHLQTHQRHGLRKRAVRMNVDRLDAAAVHHHLAAPCRAGGLRMDMRRVQKIAAREHGARHRAGGAAEEFSSRGHVPLPCSR